MYNSTSKTCLDLTVSFPLWAEGNEQFAGIELVF